MSGLGVEDVVGVVRVGSPRLSREGGLAFTVTRPLLGENRNRGELWVLWPGGGRSVVEDDSASSPAWGPGGLLAYVGRGGAGEGEAGSGVFLLTRSGPRRVAWFRHGVSRVEWLDGDRLVALVNEPVEGDYDEDGDYVATSRLPLWFDGRGLVAGLRGKLVVVDAWSGRTRDLAVDEEGVVGYRVCGGRVYYWAPLDWRRPWLHRLLVVEPGSRPRPVAEGVSIGDAACVDGRLYVAAHHGEIGIASHYKLHALTRGGLECLTCRVLDRNIWSLPGGLDGGVVLQVADRGRVGLHLYRDGSVEPLVTGAFWVHQAHALAGRVAYTMSGPRDPPEVYLLDGDAPRRVTGFNRWLAEKDLVEPVEYTVEAAGDRVDAWLYLPRGAGPSARAPLVLVVHGGPKGMSGLRFEPEFQLLASRGYAVLTVNPRGSDGYSEEFADIRGRYGEVDYEQLMAALDRALEEYPVDPERLAVTGISYGGYMTNVIVTKTRRFRAAIAENGIADWIADYWAADIGYWFDPDQIGGTPLDNLEGYVAKSPAYRAGEVETPMLIIHSMEDYRCFIDQALAMHTALLTAGKKSRLVVFRRGSHGHSRTGPPRQRRKRLELILGFLAKHLGEGIKAPGGEG